MGAIVNSVTLGEGVKQTLLDLRWRGRILTGIRGNRGIRSKRAKELVEGRVMIVEAVHSVLCANNCATEFDSASRRSTA